MSFLGKIGGKIGGLIWKQKEADTSSSSTTSSSNQGISNSIQLLGKFSVIGKNQKLLPSGKEPKIHIVGFVYNGNIATEEQEKLIAAANQIFNIPTLMNQPKDELLKIEKLLSPAITNLEQTPYHFLSEQLLSPLKEMVKDKIAANEADEFETMEIDEATSIDKQEMSDAEIENIKQSKYASVFTCLANQTFAEIKRMQINIENLPNNNKFTKIINDLLETLLKFNKEFESYEKLKGHFYKNVFTNKDKTDLEKDLRQQMRLFMKKLRDAIYYFDKNIAKAEEKHAFDICNQILNIICFAKYNLIEIFPFLQDQVEFLVSDKIIQTPKSFNDLSTAMEQLNTGVKEADRSLKKPKWVLMLQKLRGHAGIGFDASKDVNQPYLRSAQEFEKDGAIIKQRYLRYGSPTIEGIIAGMVGSASRNLNHFSYGLVPEYQAAYSSGEYIRFIEYAKTKGDMVFYCNHQHTLQTDSERGRGRAIQSLEKDTGNFHFLSMPMGDGALFDEKSDFYTSDFIKFKWNLKASFLKEITKSNTPDIGIRLPQIIIDDGEKNIMNYIDKINEIFDMVENEFLSRHAVTFSSSSKLYNDPNYRKVFILLFQAYFKRYMIFKCRELMIEKENASNQKKKYMQGEILLTSACKDNIDRGNASCSIDELLYIFETIFMQTKKPKAIDLINTFTQLLINIIGAPALVKKQEVIPSRLKLIQIVASFLEEVTKDPTNTNQITKVFGFKTLRHTFPTGLSSETPSKEK